MAKLPQDKDRISASTKSGKIMAQSQDIGKNTTRSFQERNFLSSSLPRAWIKDFGKCKYGLRKSSWALLVLSRICVDEIVNALLGMKVDPYQQPIQQHEESKAEDKYISSIHRDRLLPKSNTVIHESTPRRTNLGGIDITRLKNDEDDEDAEHYASYNTPKQSYSPPSLERRLKLTEESELTFGEE